MSTRTAPPTRTSIVPDTAEPVKYSVIGRPASNRDPAKGLSFISITEPATGRVSSLSIHGNHDDGTMRVVGNLEHNAGIVPTSKADAAALIAWLQEWKQRQA